jgi:hypothetical protein
VGRTIHRGLKCIRQTRASALARSSTRWELLTLPLALIGLDDPSSRGLRPWLLTNAPLGRSRPACSATRTVNNRPTGVFSSSSVTIEAKVVRPACQESRRHEKRTSAVALRRRVRCDRAVVCLYLAYLMLIMAALRPWNKSSRADALGSTNRPLAQSLGWQATGAPSDRPR